MPRKGRGSVWQRNGTDPTGPGALEYFEISIQRLMGPEPFDERSERFTRSRMREDRDKADAASKLLAAVSSAVMDFLDKREGHLKDAYEILASRISDRGFRKIAKEKYGLTGDPLD